jgi:hypothetical protein
LSDSPRRSLFYLQDNEDRLFWFVNYHIRNCSNSLAPSVGKTSTCASFTTQKQKLSEMVRTRATTSGANNPRHEAGGGSHQNATEMEA